MFVKKWSGEEGGKVAMGGMSIFRGFFHDFQIGLFTVYEGGRIR